MIVACVLKSGGCYTPEYVKRLKAGVDKHLTGHEFVCLTDMDVPCDKIPLQTGLKGWWAKLELFRLQSVLYFDLDTVITGDLTELVEYPHTFTMLQDFYRPNCKGSGVMAWNGDYSALLDDYRPDIKYSGHGDQGYISAKVSCDIFQGLFPGQVVSRKVAETRNANERVVCFHGEPRPHTVGWQI